ncbi:MAG: hypothetical protein NC206_10110 [Bacteroides sp.]|nr:hypothetical protein [Roseburia sp.]MCM1347420.1 hypothetical protein [Bacteroides sp.]MCM1421576.1 hypothetical protein [Bacteroides sp.]
MDWATTVSSLKTDGIDYNVILKEIEEEKIQAQSRMQPEIANEWWSRWAVVTIHQRFTKVYDLLSNSKFYEAWCEAEQVEIILKDLLRNFPDMYSTVRELHTCIHNLQSLYPYKLFCSHVIHIKQEVCSICGQQRSVRHFCGHRTGYVYNGEICHNIVTDFELKGVDIVLNPANKYSVLFTQGSDGNRQDNYDYTLLKGLMSAWKKPFQRWTYKIDIQYKSPASFPGITDSSFCPCASGLSYSECCKNNPEGIKHKCYTIIMGKE